MPSNKKDSWKHRGKKTVAETSDEDGRYIFINGKNHSANKRKEAKEWKKIGVTSPMFWFAFNMADTGCDECGRINNCEHTDGYNYWW